MDTWSKNLTISRIFKHRASPLIPFSRQLTSHFTFDTFRMEQPEITDQFKVTGQLVITDRLKIRDQLTTPSIVWRKSCWFSRDEFVLLEACPSTAVTSAVDCRR